MTERDFDKVLSRQLLSGGQWNRLQVLLLSAPGLSKTYVYGNKMFEKNFENVLFSLNIVVLLSNVG